MSSSGIEDLYPLSPVQQGMLFHSLDASDTPGSGTYLNQKVLSFAGDLDVAAMVRAWQTALTRHSILRTAFVWEDLEEPLQVVMERVDLPFAVLDWRRLEARRREREMAGLIRLDRWRGLDLSTAPALRLTLVLLEERDYRLLLSYHHLLLDGWSVPLLVRDIAALYDSFSRGRSIELPRTRPYRDYIAWLKSRDPATSERFWKLALEGVTAPTPLSVDSPALTTRGNGDSGLSQRRLECPAKLGEAAVGLAGSHALTVNTLVQGAWATLLARYSGEEDVVFGATVSGRPPELPGVESMVGLFINTVPVRLRVPPTAPVLTWLARLQELQVESRQHEHCPLVDIQGWSEIPRGQPIFESILVFENYPVQVGQTGPGPGDSGPGDSGAATVAVGEMDSIEVTNYPLTLLARPTPLTVRADFQRRRFDDSTVERLLGHLRRWLEGLVAEPSSALGELTILSVAQRQQLLVEWNDTGAGTGEALLHRRIEAQVALCPEATALVFDERHSSYLQLDREAGSLAGHLLGLGAGTEQTVGVFLDRSPELVLTLLATLKAGAAYLPLDPDYPTERIAFMLGDARCSVVVTSGDLASRLPELPKGSSRPLLLDQGVPASSSQPIAASAALDPATAAYTIYTSGSTGRPKGAINSHRAIVNRLDWMQQRYRLDGSDRVLQKTPMSFDVSVWEFFWPLLTGATLVLARPGEHREPALLARRIADERVTTLHFVPSMLRGFLEEPGAAEGDALQRVIASGEALGGDLARRFHEVLDAELHNLYGPTEAAVDVTAWPADGRGEASAVPIGRPISGVRIHLFDRRFEPAAIGVPGELMIGGIALARGYLVRPGLSAERFVPDPVGRPGGRLYHTGDLARYAAGGEIEFLGRLDHQVKLRGVRVELGEIETVLAAHPAVLEALAAVRGGATPVLVVWVGLAGEERPSEAELLDHARAELPEAMLPNFVVVLDELPHLPNGKVDRRALPEPAAASGGAGRAPRGPLEEMLLDIWEEVLAGEQIGVEDNFFELGGHSLLAMRLVSRVREATGVELLVRTVFDAPTVAGMAREVERRLRAADGAEVPALRPVPRPEGELFEAPLSFAQERLWFLDQLDPGSSAYNVPSALRVSGPLEPARLAHALTAVFERHESLRVSFPEVAARPVQRIAEPAEVALPEVDLSRLASAEREHTAQRLADEEARRSFDLGRGGVARLRLLRLADEEHVLLVTMHHIASDAWSLGILVREVTAFYEADGRPAHLAELPIQYPDFAHWQRRWLSGEVLERELGFWREQLGGVPVLDLPTDRSRPAVQTTRGAAVSFELERDLAAAAGELCRRLRLTPFMLLTAAFGTLLGRYADQSDLALGTPIAGRERLETEALIGLFVNTLVLRLDLAGRPSFGDLLAQVRETTLGAYAHPDLPFELLVEELQPERSLSHSPLFQVMFSFQNVPDQEWRLSEIELRPFHQPIGTAKFDLELLMNEVGGRMGGVLEYNLDLFEKATVERFLDHFKNFLTVVVADPEHRVWEVDLMAEAERRQVVGTWNKTAWEPPTSGGFTELFAGWVERAPDTVAAGDGEAALTYHELDRRTSRLAAALIETSPGAEGVVAVLGARSLGFLESLVAILRAGAAYLPLDLHHPPQRLADVLERAGARLVLVEPGSEELLRRAMGTLGLRERPAVLDWHVEAEPSATAPSASLAYVLFTSGSTGRPKGAMVERSGMVNHLWAKVHDLGMSSQDVIAQNASQSFDISVWQFLAPLIAGARLEVVSEAEAHDPTRLIEAVERRRVTILEVVPSLLGFMLDEVERRPQERPRFAALRWMIPTGEALAPDFCRRWLVAYPEIPVLNAYGPTECSDDVTHAAISAPPSMELARMPIGRALPNTRLYVIDRAGGAVPPGGSGELRVGGEGVGRGYVAAPVLSATAFVPDPFSGLPGDRLYCTGDRVRWLATGELEYLGRLDHQVKVRGFRIELGEIENQLAAHPEVRECVVVVQGVGAGERLVAYLAAVGEEGPAGLRTWLRERLPEPMVPALFIELEALPRLPSGKANRGELSRRPLPEVEVERRHEPPRTQAEELLAEFWRELLGVGEVGRQDNFFDLGGHSLLATQLMSRIRQAFGIELPLRALFEQPTLAGLATRTESARRGHRRGRGAGHRARAADSGAAALLRPATPVVPRSARPGPGDLQHPGGGGARR